MLSRSLTLLLLVCYCVTTRAADNSPTQFLDERTGATITIVRKPWVFALDRSIFAANARDYVNITAAEINRSGQIQLYLIGYIWSSSDRRHNTAQADLAARPLEIAADGRVIPLRPEAEFPKDFLNDKQLLAPKWSQSRRAAYLISREALHHIAHSGQLSLSFVAATSDDEQSDAARDEERETYESWDEGRKALQAFDEQTAGYQ